MYFTFIDFNNSHVQRLNMSPNACAFNVGVFVTDLELWRKHNVTAQLENWLVLNKKYVNRNYRKLGYRINVAYTLRGQLLKGRICSPRSKFFPLRVDPRHMSTSHCFFRHF